MAYDKVKPFFYRNISQKKIYPLLTHYFLLGDATKDMRIVPVNFNSEHKAMLGHCKMIMENDGGRIAINPDRFDKLITTLRTAMDNDGTLDKEATSYNDIFDAFRLALKFYHFVERTD
jgi:hypothetical protein